jgi:hypothetical protein
LGNYDDNFITDPGAVMRARARSVLPSDLPPSENAYERHARERREADAAKAAEEQENVARWLREEAGREQQQKQAAEIDAAERVQVLAEVTADALDAFADAINELQDRCDAQERRIAALEQRIGEPSLGSEAVLPDVLSHRRLSS